MYSKHFGRMYSTHFGKIAGELGIFEYLGHVGPTRPGQLQAVHWTMDRTTKRANREIDILLVLYTYLQGIPPKIGFRKKQNL